jgi:hypothetical protein
MRSKPDREDARDPDRRATEPSFYERAIRTSIGRGLRNYYDLSEPIPEHMLKLLKQIDTKSKTQDKQTSDKAPEDASECGSN